jgi:TM2 domain-containing membrane protein YozV
MVAQTFSVKMRMEGKSNVIAYLLWWFLGMFGGHRFYLGRLKTAIAQLLLFSVGVLTAFVIFGWVLLFTWFVWWALDAYFTYQMVVEENRKLGVMDSNFSWVKDNGVENELDQLETLHALFEKGVITKEQYEAKKSTLL